MNQQDRTFLPAIGLIALLAILATATAILLVNEPPAPEATPTIPVRAAALSAPTLTQTPSATFTSTVSAPPTWTLQPSISPTRTATFTSTSTPTRVRIPTLTPARPYKFNLRYEFNPLTAELMDQIVRTIADYPDAKFKPEDRLSAAYNAEFIYPALIQQEAMLRFPDSPQSEAWQDSLAYSQARLNDSQATQHFVNRLQTAINSSEVNLTDLPDWFNTKFPDLTLQVHALDTTSINSTFKLLIIPESQSVFLLQIETESQARLYPLTSTFTFNIPDPIQFALTDAGRDGSPKLGIYLPRSPGNTILATPLLFDLNVTPPRPLPVQDIPPIDYFIESQVIVRGFEADTDTALLQVEAVFYPPCPVTVTRTYRWNGSQAIPDEPTYTAQPVADFLSYCAPILDLTGDFWPPDGRLALVEALLPYWPPESDSQGRPFPADAADQLHFHQAVDLALIGRTLAAYDALQSLIQNPTDPSSSWIDAANQFAQSLQAGDSLYLACRAAPACELRDAVQATINISNVSDIREAFRALQQAGLWIGASGDFDFDMDSQPERWFTLRPRDNDRLEFWLLAAFPGGIKAVLVDQVDVNDPIPYWSEANTYPGVFQIEPRRGYRLARTSGSLLPYLETLVVEPVLTTYTRDEVFRAERNLFDGQEPALVRGQLLALRESGRFNCINHQVCDRFRYILGLASELSGEEILARDTYIELWWENSASPLAAAARLKLLFVPATPAPSPTPRRTPTPTP